MFLSLAYVVAEIWALISLLTTESRVMFITGNLLIVFSAVLLILYSRWWGNKYTI